MVASASTPAWLKRSGDRLLVSVRLTPRAGRDAIDGIDTLSDGREVLAARVRAVPEDGRANAALCLLIAAAAGLPKSAASIEGGATSRLKTVALDPAGPDAERALAALPRR